MISLPPYAKVVGIGVGAVVLIGLLSWGGVKTYKRLFGPPDQFEILKAKDEAAEKEIKRLMELNEKANEELQEAKRESKAAYERSQNAARIASQWQARYRAVAAERDAIKRAATGNEAVAELRRLGWIK